MAVSVSAPVFSLCFHRTGEQSSLFGYRKQRRLSSGRNSRSSIGFGAVEKVRKSARVRVPICRAVPPLLFKDLDADDFRHPLDKQNTLLLRAIPGLNEFGKAMLGSMTEQIMLLENIGTSVLVSKNQVLLFFERFIPFSFVLVSANNET